MKKYLFILSLAVLASCTKQPLDGYVTIPTGYTMVESHSMVKAASEHDAIVAAIDKCLPESITVSAQSNGAFTDVTIGQTVTLKYGTYSFNGVYRSASTVYFSDYIMFANEPFLDILKSNVEITANTTELILPATYSCYAVVAKANEVSGFKATMGSSADLPSAVIDDYIITFIYGTYDGMGTITALAANSDDYYSRAINAPRDRSCYGKYFYIELQRNGSTIVPELSYPDWINAE